MPITEQHRRMRARNYALGGVLLALVLLFFAVTIVKMKGIN
ncbi:MAG TPA: hypothetical protein VEU47_13545 [Candidatus Cybelea sp.]|nr:hypothetical protein [Candidatus Cybelea sp.]